MANSKLSYYPAIDGFRALAVLVVILFHLEIEWFSGGYVGVDMFFVISGYLITRNIVFDLKENQFSFLNFYAARIRRLIPALLATIVATLIFGFLLFSPDALIRLSGSAIAGALSLANIRYWMNSGYFDVDSDLKPLLHLWSLSVEEQFYFIWPLLLLLIIGCIKNTNFRLILICGIAFISLLITHRYLDDSPSTVFFWMPFRIYEFALGALLVFFEKTHRFKLIKKSEITLFLCCVFGLILIVYSIIEFNKLTKFPGINSLYPCAGMVLLLIARESNFVSSLFSNKIARSLGKASYSLYLAHWPIWVFTTFWIGSIVSNYQKLIIFTAIILIGYLLHYLVEIKFRYKTKNKGNYTFYLTLLLVVLFILAFSFLTRASQGWPQRINFTVHDYTYNESKFCQYPERNREIRECSFGSGITNAKKVLLIGDSHSMNLAHGLHDFAVENNLSVDAYSVAGCPPLLGVEVYMSNSETPTKNCTDFSAKLPALMTKNDYDFVILSARWGWFLEHDEYYVGQKPPKVYLHDKLSKNKSADESKQVWQRALTATINKAGEYVDHIVIFSQYPLLHKGIGECDKSPSWLINQKDLMKRCEVKIPYPVIENRLNFMNEFIKTIENEKITAVIPFDVFCDNKTKVCDVLTDDGLLYLDDNHISPLGSIYLFSKIQVKLKAIFE